MKANTLEDKAAIWARVSTRSQTEENQLIALREWIGRLGYTIVKEYSIQASAWKREHTVLRSKAIKEAGHIYGKLFVVDLDRLSRSGIADLMNTVAQIQANGAQVISMNQEFTNVPPHMVPLMMALWAWIAEFQSAQKSANVLRGIARAREQGKHVGRRWGSKDKKMRRKSGYKRRQEDRPGGRWADLTLDEMEAAAIEIRASGKRISGALAEVLREARQRAGVDTSDRHAVYLHVQKVKKRLAEAKATAA